MTGGASSTAGRDDRAWHRGRASVRVPDPPYDRHARAASRRRGSSSVTVDSDASDSDASARSTAGTWRRSCGPCCGARGSERVRNLFDAHGPQSACEGLDLHQMLGFGRISVHDCTSRLDEYRAPRSRRWVQRTATRVHPLPGFLHHGFRRCSIPAVVYERPTVVGQSPRDSRTAPVPSATLFASRSRTAPPPAKRGHPTDRRYRRHRCARCKGALDSG